MELDARTFLGPFGPNPPSTYSPPALGLPGLVEVGGEQDDEDVDRSVPDATQGPG